MIFQFFLSVKTWIYHYQNQKATFQLAIFLLFQKRNNRFLRNRSILSSGKQNGSTSGEPPQQQHQQDTASWFPALRSKLSSFSMSDWLVSLGLSRRRVSDSQSFDIYATDVVDEGRKTVSAPATRESSAEPNCSLVDGKFKRKRSASPPLGPIIDDDLLTPISENPDGSPKKEPFELPNFWLNLEPGRHYMDTLELQHFGPLEDLLPIGKKKLGSGHEFHVVQLNNPTWCDKCGDFIWGSYKQAVKCKFCNYTCHYKCRMLVTLDCLSVTGSILSGSTDGTYLSAKSINLPPQCLTESWNENVDMPQHLDSCQEGPSPVDEVVVEESPLDWPNDSMQHGKALDEAIRHYNLTADGLEMKLDETGESFSGYLQVHMNFTRPINIVAGQKPPTIYDVIKEDTIIPQSEQRTITSFFLPRNTVKTIHITSKATCRELIVSLLKKFKVADNPLKFALYERSCEKNGNTIKAHLRRISDDVCPLRLQLTWGTKSERQLVLQENNTGDILWDAFEIPELNNFLKILELEEQQYVWQIRQRYSLYRHYLELEIREKSTANHVENPDRNGDSNERDNCSDNRIGMNAEEGIVHNRNDENATIRVKDVESLSRAQWETFGSV